MFAAERTYAAWFAPALRPWRAASARRSILVFFSAFCFGAAIWRQVFAGPPPRPDVPRIRPELLMIVNGFLVLVALSALFGIWFGRTGGD